MTVVDINENKYCAQNVNPYNDPGGDRGRPRGRIYDCMRLRCVLEFREGELFTVQQNGHKRNRHIVDYTWTAGPTVVSFNRLSVFDYTLMNQPGYLFNTSERNQQD